MKRIHTIFHFFFLLLLTISTHAQELTIYPQPPDMLAAPDFELWVNGEKVFVYNTRSAAFASFSFSGKIELRVKSAAKISSHAVRPQALGIITSSGERELTFAIDKPAHLSVEINGNIKRPLFIFANPPETSVPKKGQTGVIFFEKGKLHRPGLVHIKSGQEVYIEGGAVVQGYFIADRATNIKIHGRGIIDHSRYDKGQVRPIEINRSDNVDIEGIIIAESKHWSAGSYASRNVRYSNFKVVSDNDWDDGIDIVGSKNITVDNCFIRTKDDCIAIKGGVNYFGTFKTDLTVDSILVQNSVFWNGVWGNALEIGFETSVDTIRNIVFRNCDLIHVEGPEGTFTIHNGDRALVQNVLYDNIRVEEVQGLLVDFKILFSQYSTDKSRGRISNIRFKNINVTGDSFPNSLLKGFDESHLIQGVSFSNLMILGKQIHNPEDMQLQSSFSNQITFEN